SASTAGASRTGPTERPKTRRRSALRRMEATFSTLLAHLMVFARLRLAARNLRSLRAPLRGACGRVGERGGAAFRVAQRVAGAAPARGLCPAQHPLLRRVGARDVRLRRRLRGGAGA